MAGGYSKYYTGEAYWALARLHRLFPDEGFGEVADRIGNYLATERDDVEDYWPPIPDHWAAYGLAETVAVPRARPSRARSPTPSSPTPAARPGCSAARCAGSASRPGRGAPLVRGTRVPRGGGYGVVGEALTGLWRVAEADDRLADLHGPVAERAMCIAGLAIEVQSGAAEASRPGPEPGPRCLVRRRVHADGRPAARHLAALLRTSPSSRPAPGGARCRGRCRSAWLWLLALLAAFNPIRAALAVPRDNRSRRAIGGLAAAGGVVGSLLVLAIALASGPLVDALGVSDPALRLAVGVVAGVVGIIELIRRAPSPEPALPGWKAALVPVAVPSVAGAALVMLAIGAYADRGLAVVGAALTVGVVCLTLLAPVTPPAGAGRRGVLWAAKVLSAALVVAGVLLVIDGVFDV